jgi:hypothetical protein
VITSAEAAIYQRWSVRKKAWIDVDPPNLLVRMALARARRWAYCRFDSGSAKQLGELLKAVAVFAVGGVAALEASKDAGAGAVKLLSQLRLIP